MFSSLVVVVMYSKLLVFHTSICSHISSILMLLTDDTKNVSYEKMRDNQCSVQFSTVQSLSHVLLFATSWTAAHQASLSITNSWISLKLMSVESVMPSSHLILCCPLLLLPSVFPSIRVFLNESALCIRWPKYWSISFRISTFQ